MALSDDKIKGVLESEEMKAKVDDPSSMDRIKSGFESAFAKIKDRLGDSWQDGREIYNMVMDKDFKVENKYKYVVYGALIYLVSPIDLLPEAVFGPVVGLLDDIAVIMLAINYAKPEIARYQAFKATQPEVSEEPNTTEDAGTTDEAAS
jgi:uncharacterized membrane protein YkvA (DUF1232 family)